MRPLKHIFQTGFGSKLPAILQTESTECGLACLAMIAGFYGYNTDLSSLRREFSISLKGATLADLISIATRMHLATRPLKLQLETLKSLTLPCILHWDFNHFVVLKEVTSTSVTIHDPAVGVRKLSWSEVSHSFTGIALEVWPNPGFRQEEKKRKLDLRRLIGPVTNIYRPFLQILALALVLELVGLINPLFMQWVIDEVLVTRNNDLLTVLVLGFGLLLLARVAIGMLRSWMLLCLGTTLKLQWKSNVFQHLLRLPVRYFEKRHLGDVVSRFESIEEIQRVLTSEFVEAILDGLMAIITLTMMFLYSPVLGAIVLATAVLYTGVRFAFYGPLYAAGTEQIIHHAKQESHFIESVRGVKPIKLFQREDERYLSWLSLVVDQTNAHMRMDKLGITNQAVNKLLFGLEGILVTWLGAKLVMTGDFTAGALIAFLAYKDQFDTRATGLIDKFFDFKLLRVQTERLADIVLEEAEPMPASKAAETKWENLAPSIEVRNVSFQYMDGEPLVLRDVSMKIEAGESVAIVGPSGSGKSTLANVILGVLAPTEGEVLVGGVSMREAGVGALRRMIGTVMQDDVLLAGSIGDNISFFDPQGDRNRIEACARLASIHDDIMAMPMQYDTLVGDMGTVLSGGQKQRVLLARALYKKPSILVLDEATSALDVEREAEVNQAIRDMKITRIIIAHRPETIRSADRAILLVGGEVLDPDTLAMLEAGTHPEDSAAP